MSTETEVVNLKLGERCTVPIYRGTKWGNPFRSGKDGTREEVIAMYREYLYMRQDLLEALIELKDQKLGCFCHPSPCHGDVLVEEVEKRFG